MSVLPKDYHMLFNGTELGRQVLDDMREKFERRLSYAPGGYAAQRQTDFNEGQRFVIAYILNTIENANLPEERARLEFPLIP